MQMQRYGGWERRVLVAGKNHVPSNRLFGTLSSCGPIEQSPKSVSQYIRVRGEAGWLLLNSQKACTTGAPLGSSSPMSFTNWLPSGCGEAVKVADVD